MNYNVLAIRTDGSGFSNITAGIDDQHRASSQADTLNSGSLYIMQADSHGAERAIPDIIYSAGYGTEIFHHDGTLVAPYNGEISSSTAQLVKMVSDRIEKFGAEGVVRFDAYDATNKFDLHAAPDVKRSAMATVFNRIDDSMGRIPQSGTSATTGGRLAPDVLKR